MWDDPRSTEFSTRYSTPQGPGVPFPAGPRPRPAQRRRLRRAGDDPDASYPRQGVTELPPTVGAPRITLPSQPVPQVNPRRRGIRSRLSERLPLRRPAPDSWDEYARGDAEWGSVSWPLGRVAVADDPSDSGARARERTAARPITARQQAITAQQQAIPLTTSARRRAIRRPTPPPEPASSRLPAVLPTDSVPGLYAYQAPLGAHGLLARAPLHTRRIIQRASRPWSLARLVVALLVIVVAIVASFSAAGEPPQPVFAYKTVAGSGSAAPIDANVVPITQLIRCDEYDSFQQCQDYGNAACSAAAMTEIFTAWSIPKITIGRMIRELGPDISPNGGLLTHDGFQRVAAQHGFRADLSSSLSYNQILYIVNNLGYPLIVDVRISYGYYHFLAGGHFLVATGGDANGLRITDSSEYYIHYLPKDVFYSMFTGRTALLLPQENQYTLPKS